PISMNNADPADADALRPRRQPQVLNGTYRAKEVHVRLARSAEDHRAKALTIAGHADVERRLQDAFQLEGGVEFLPFALEELDRLGIGLVERFMNLLSDGRVANQNEIPGLHEADGGGMMGSLENAGQNIVGNRLAAEAAHVAALKNGPIQPCPLGIGKW